MRQVHPRFLAICSLLLFAAILNACSLGRSSPPTRLYVLTALSRPEGSQSRASTAGLAIGVGPVELPQYVNRPQIITGESENELQREPFAQWAEPLETNVTRVLAENLSQLLATERVAVFPWKGPVPLDYQVVVEVIQFLGTPNGSVSLIAMWRVLGKDGQAPLVSRQSRFTEPTRSSDYTALAGAMSRTVASLSRDIATAITELSRQGARS